MPGLYCSCSKHDHSLCPISIIDVSKYSFFVVPAHMHCQNTSSLRLPWSEFCSKSIHLLLVRVCHSHVQTTHWLISVLLYARHKYTFHQSLGPTVRLPVSITDFYLLFFMSVSVLLFRTCSNYSPWKKQGNDLSEENHFCSNLRGKQKIDGSPSVPWPQALLL